MSFLIDKTNNHFNLAFATFLSFPQFPGVLCLAASMHQPPKPQPRSQAISSGPTYTQQVTNSRSINTCGWNRTSHPEPGFHDSRSDVRHTLPVISAGQKPGETVAIPSWSIVNSLMSLHQSVNIVRAIGCPWAGVPN